MLRPSFPTLLRSGDIVVANDAATLPASIFGVHKRTCRSIEVRLASSGSVFDEDVRQFSAVVFGEGNYRTPTERRPAHLNFILAIRFNWDLSQQLFLSYSATRDSC